MNDNLLGTGLIIAGSLLNGLWAYPMKCVKNWRWENIWFLFGLFGLVILPWAVALLTVPGLFSIYSKTPGPLILGVVGLGCAWGVGSLLFGLGVSALGFSLGYAMVIGTSAVLGTVIPALVFNPDLLLTRKGGALMAALVIMIAGLVCFVAAGRKREAMTANDSGAGNYKILSNTEFLRGMGICFLSGLLSACFNIGFAVTRPLLDLVVESGTSRTFATNAVWALVMSSGFVPSALYCVWLFRQHRSLKQFTKGTVNWLYGILMGFLWMASVILYGFGAVSMGSAGATLGWPILMAGTVITANLLGLATGEWIGTGWETKKYLFTGIGLLVLSVVIIGSAG
ncbi:MAG: hypothetical protein EXQ58_03780 [Acidobacteria bacterium]|nr:hypothetical protein [Acidobacteriota bacterium]